jgi:hypothetical protein
MRQIEGYDGEEGVHARRLRESLEPAAVTPCLVMGGLEIPAKGIVFV